jgi:hypothetical protein
MTRERSNGVTFCSTPNYCELAIESRENLYIVRFWKNGDKDLAHNCLKVDSLPVSPLSTQLLKAAQSHEESIRAYMSAKDTEAGSRLYWRIKDALAGNHAALYPRHSV